MTPALSTGLVLGFLVAAQVGPIWLLCLRSSLGAGFAVGLAIGVGAAVIDTLYAAAGAAGASSLLEIDALRLTLGLLGACVLAAIGVRAIWSGFRIRLGGESRDEVGSPRRAFVTSLGATASNPLTIVSWAAVFSAASTASLVDTSSGALALAAGVGVGSLVWFALLAGGASLVGRRIGPRSLAAADVLSGGAIIGFAALLGYRTIRDA